MKFGYKIKATWKGNEQFYNVWNGMLKRCYDSNHVRANSYKNVQVCERWHCFDYFLEDVKQIEGWNEEEFKNKTIQLDKDYKQPNQEIKTYSKNTCMWLDKKKNNKFQSHHMKDFKAISPNGVEYKYNNQHECAREHNLDNISICACLKGKRKTHRGWKFQYINKTCND